MLIEKLQPRMWDDRREIIVPGDAAATLTYCVEHFIATAHQAVKSRGAFFVALSGGSTPQALYKTLSSSPYKEMVPWAQCHLFWSDERSVPPSDKDSNYHMAMEAGLAHLPIPPQQIHRMHAETHIEQSAIDYEQEIQSHLKGQPFDLIMLGLGEDGHTASLFPHTQGLFVTTHWVTAHFVPPKNTWRMTLTYPCINAARNCVIYVLGEAKKEILAKVLFSSSHLYPAEQVGTSQNKALWIADQAAAEILSLKKEKAPLNSRK